jgi:hypothetical protein
MHRDRFKFQTANLKYTLKYTSAFSRRDAPESCMDLSPNRGRGECRVPVAPAALRAKVESTQASHHGRTGITRHSRTQWF